MNLGYDVYGKIILHIQQKPYSNQLVQTVTKVDPVFGEVDTTTTTTWVTQGIGATCWEINDVVNQYYDYSGQSAYIPFFSGTPVQVTTTDVTMGLNQATIQNYSYRFGNAWKRGSFAVPTNRQAERICEAPESDDGSEPGRPKPGGCERNRLVPGGQGRTSTLTRTQATAAPRGVLETTEGPRAA